MIKTTTTAIDLTQIDRIVKEVGRDPDVVIPILQAVQEVYRYLPPEALERVCELTDITPASMIGVSSFYDHFRHKPAGRHMISICTGTACHVKGANLVDDAIRQKLELAPREDTDADGMDEVHNTQGNGWCKATMVNRDGKLVTEVTSHTRRWSQLQ